MTNLYTHYLSNVSKMLRLNSQVQYWKKKNLQLLFVNYSVYAVWIIYIIKVYCEMMSTLGPVSEDHEPLRNLKSTVWND